jgi:hypothetical protein
MQLRGIRLLTVSGKAMISHKGLRATPSIGGFMRQFWRVTQTVPDTPVRSSSGMGVPEEVNVATEGDGRATFRSWYTVLGAAEIPFSMAGNNCPGGGQ